LFVPFIETFLAEKQMAGNSLLLDNEHKVNNSIFLNTSFSDECCSYCPCFKKSEDLN
jgi:hypothetical protein